MRNTQIQKKTLFPLILIILAGESVFFLPFVIQRVFRPTFLDVFELTNYELGICFSVYGLVGLFSYFFGGTLADKFSPRILMALALVFTALGGVWMANYPAYTDLKWLYGYWGFTSIFLFWGAMIKQTRIWGGAKNQGIAFGFLDGGRGLVAAVLSSVGILIFAHYMGDATDLTLSERREAFKGVLIFTSVFVAAIGILVFFFLDKNGEPNTSTDASQVFVWRDFMKVMNMPSVWYLTMIVFCAYMGYKVTDIFSLYAKEVMLYDEITAARNRVHTAVLKTGSGRDYWFIGGSHSGFFPNFIGLYNDVCGEYILCVRHHQSRTEWFIFYRNRFICCRDICFARPLFFYFERGTYTRHFNGDCSRSHQFYCLYA